MKKFLSGVGLVAVLSVARAHDSWAPHTHAIDNRHSDLFYLCVAGTITLVVGALVRRALVKRRDSKPVRDRRMVD